MGMNNRALAINVNTTRKLALGLIMQASFDYARISQALIIPSFFQI